MLRNGGFDHVRHAGRKEGNMPIGKIKTLVHLSQQTHVPSTRLVSGRNDKGYGIIAADDGREVYFSHETIAGLHGFDDLRRGQQLDYTLDEPFLRASSVKRVTSAPEIVLGPAA
jgi:cold shock CspA family protein